MMLKISVKTASYNFGSYLTSDCLVAENYYAIWNQFLSFNLWYPCSRDWKKQLRKVFFSTNFEYHRENS